MIDCVARVVAFFRLVCKPVRACADGSSLALSLKFAFLLNVVAAHLARACRTNVLVANTNMHRMVQSTFTLATQLQAELTPDADEEQLPPQLQRMYAADDGSVISRQDAIVKSVEEVALSPRANSCTRARRSHRALSAHDSCLRPNPTSTVRRFRPTLVTTAARRRLCRPAFRLNLFSQTRCANSSSIRSLPSSSTTIRSRRRCWPVRLLQTSQDQC